MSTLWRYKCSFTTSTPDQIKQKGASPTSPFTSSLGTPGPAISIIRHSLEHDIQLAISLPTQCFIVCRAQQLALTGNSGMQVQTAATKPVKPFIQCAQCRGSRSEVISGLNIAVWQHVTQTGKSMWSPGLAVRQPAPTALCPWAAAIQSASLLG